MRVDWFRVIADLTRRGYTTRSLADAIHVPPATLLGWKQGAEPKYGDGERLVLLWAELTDTDRARVPLCPILSGLHPPGQP